MALNEEALMQLRQLDPDGSMGVIAGLVDSYLRDAASLLQKMRTAMSEGDATSLARYAHSLKSTSASMGATRVSEIAKEMEKAARNQAVDACPSFLTALTAEQAVAERLLREVCATA